MAKKKSDQVTTASPSGSGDCSSGPAACVRRAWVAAARIRLIATDDIQVTGKPELFREALVLANAHVRRDTKLRELIAEWTLRKADIRSEAARIEFEAAKGDLEDLIRRY